MGLKKGQEVLVFSMRCFMNNIFLMTKKQISLNFHLLMKLSCLLFVAFFLAGFSADQADASTGIKIYDYSSNKTSTYTGVIPKVICNGTSIGNSKTPGILVNGVAVLPYEDIFMNSKITAECGYNKDKGTITISKYGITVVMTVGSKKATVNGKAVTLTVAPLKMKYVSSGITKVLVPSRFVSESLGLGYTWNSATSTVTIEKYSLQLSYDSKDKFEYLGAQGKVTIDGTSVDLGTMPSIITNNTAMLRAKKVFADSAIDADYFYDKVSQRITMIKGDNVLIMTVGSTEALLNNKSVKLDTAPLIVTNYETDSSYVMVPGSFTAASLGYE
jgi:N-acetylmuramoyl-L-alanine amidase